MGLKISEKNKSRLTLIVILLVFVSITVYSLNAGLNIEVEEGHEEISISYIKEGNIQKTYFNETTNRWYKNATAKTYVDGNNTLQLTIIVRSITSDETFQYVNVHMNVIGDFKPDYNLEKLLLKIKGLDEDKSSHYSYDFKTSFLNTKNLTKWNPNDNIPGTIGTKESYIGFDVKQNNFSGEVRFQWMIQNKYWGKNYTIQIKASLNDFSKNVDSTVNVNLEGDFRA